jgi:hypothetical protein
MIGERLLRRPDEPTDRDGLVYRIIIQPGAYGFANDQWWACTPNGLSANLRRHTTVEHEDGTITVTPSILVNEGREQSWHGYLTRGEWKEC